MRGLAFRTVVTYLIFCWKLVSPSRPTRPSASPAHSPSPRFSSLLPKCEGPQQPASISQPYQRLPGALPLSTCLYQGLENIQTNPVSRGSCTTNLQKPEWPRIPRYQFFSSNAGGCYIGQAKYG